MRENSVGEMAGTSLILAFVLGALVLVVPRLFVTQAGQTQTMEKRVHIKPPGAGESRYYYVPFEVPAGASRVSISYDYDRANDANTLDLGLFDARSTEATARNENADGFRGWSGGRHRTISVARTEATPGYTPGDLPTGKWRVIFGLYRVAPTGVDVSLRIKIETNAYASTNPASAPRATNIPPSGANLPASAADKPLQRTPLLPSTTASAESQWYQGDLHTHTVHSDGEWTINELLTAAGTSKLDFISITDHNTMSHHAEIDRSAGRSGSPLVLRGEEVTTYGGHANAWGLPSGGWLDFRVRRGDSARMSNIIAEAHRHGALISVNHPFARCKDCDWSYDQALLTNSDGFDAIEVWNGPWDDTDEQALRMWNRVLRSGRRITAIGASDSHRPTNVIGHPTTHVRASRLSEQALLGAIRDGHVYVTREAANFRLAFEAEPVSGGPKMRRGIGEEVPLNAPGRVRLLIAVEAAPDKAAVQLISNDETVRQVPFDSSRREQTIELECKADSYFRIEVRDQAGRMLAFTNPIYVTTSTSRTKVATKRS